MINCSVQIYWDTEAIPVKKTFVMQTCRARNFKQNYKVSKSRHFATSYENLVASTFGRQTTNIV